LPGETIPCQTFPNQDLRSYTNYSGNGALRYALPTLHSPPYI